MDSKPSDNDAGASGDSKDVKAAGTITIRVKDQQGEDTFFKVKKTTKMEKVFTAYAQRKGVALAQVRFLLDGVRIQPTDTPENLEIEDQDQIDCVLGKSCFFSISISAAPIICLTIACVSIYRTNWWAMNKMMTSGCLLPFFIAI